MPRVFALSIHADYACRHSGACCTAGWAIPVEQPLRRIIDVAVLLPESSGACPQFDADTRLCRVQRDHGEALLPVSCDQFPRRTLVDARGLFVTLSHFCPTAASQLFHDDVPLAVVEGPAAFPTDRRYDPLDARDTWPPLVRPSVLFDHDSYSRWERYVVAAFAQERTVDAALADVASAAERLRQWTPDRGEFSEYVSRALTDATTQTDPLALDRYASLRRADAYLSVLGAVPDGVQRPAAPPDLDAQLDRLPAAGWPSWSAPARRFLAAKAFGSWTAYQSRGLRTMVAELVASELVVRVEAARASVARRQPLDEPRLLEAFRESDRLLVHLADRETLLRWLGRVEA